MSIKINFKQLLILIVELILVAFIIGTQIKCNRLQNDLNKAKRDNMELIDSLEFINKKYLENIESNKKDVLRFEEIIDSLEKAKTYIIYNKESYVVSKDVSVSAKQLNDNLSKWRK